MIEVEMRGLIHEPIEKAIHNLKEKATFEEEKDRLSILYNEGDFVTDVRQVAHQKRDLRLRFTNKKPELVIKYGKWGASDEREEVSLILTLEQAEKINRILNLMGLDKARIVTTKTQVFRYKEVEIALVEANGVTYFEAEKVIRHAKDIEKTREEVSRACKELGLRTISDKEARDLINEINERNKDDNIDLMEVSFKDLKKKFKPFFPE